VFVADEIGLGKTVTAISTAKRLSDLGLAKRVLILVPRILVRQWLLELGRFGIRVTRIERANFQSLSLSGFPEGFYVASMDLVKRERYMDKILGVSWDLLIVDEAHRVGKSSAKKRPRGTDLSLGLRSTSPSISFCFLLRPTVETLLTE